MNKKELKKLERQLWLLISGPINSKGTARVARMMLNDFGLDATGKYITDNPVFDKNPNIPAWVSDLRRCHSSAHEDVRSRLKEGLGEIYNAWLKDQGPDEPVSDEPDDSEHDTRFDRRRACLIPMDMFTETPGLVLTVVRGRATVAYKGVVYKGRLCWDDDEGGYVVPVPEDDPIVHAITRKHCLIEPTVTVYEREPDYFRLYRI